MFSIDIQLGGGHLGDLIFIGLGNNALFLDIFICKSLFSVFFWILKIYLSTPLTQPYACVTIDLFVLHQFCGNDHQSMKLRVYTFSFIIVGVIQV